MAGVVGGRHRERGQSLVELALILPVLLIIVMGLLDIGRLYFAYVAVTDAAGEGVAYAAYHPEDDPGIGQRAQSATGGMIVLGPAEDVVQTTFESAESGSPITVTVVYTHTLATPLMRVIVPEGTLLLRGVATEAILVGTP